MKKPLLQQIAPHALAIGIFLVVACLYCLPAIQGMVVNQSDMLGWRGMAQQSLEFKEKYGHLPLWTNSTFSGMPAYQIAVGTKYSINLFWLHHLFTLFLPAPAGLFFLCCVCFYILCMVLRQRPWIGIFGSLAYGFASYNAILYATGHVTKFATIGYIPAVLAGLILITQRKYFLGFAATLLFGTLLICQNHIQVVYYTFLIIGCMGVAYAIHAIRQKEVKHLLISGGLSVVALGISMAAYAAMLVPLNEYAKETMRGGRSELTINQPEGNKTKGGLDKDYAFMWSYGIGETATIMVPGARGGSNSTATELNPEKSHALEAMQNAGLPSQAVNYFFSYYLSPYWGDQPSTAGPVYMGAIVCLLFIAGLFFVRNWHLGWIIAASVVGIVLAWGSNLPSVNYFLFDHLPFYNKFRAPSMALIIPQVTFPLLAAMALQEIFYRDWDKQVLNKKLKNAGIATAAIVAVLAFSYINSDFRSPNDGRIRQGLAGTLTQMMGQGKASEQAAQQANTMAGSIYNGLTQDRKDMYGGDLTRTIIFLVLGAGLVWLAASKKLKGQYAVIGLAALTLIDQIPIDNRYLNKDNYLPEDEFLAQRFNPTAADLQIQQDTSYYRVFDATGSSFQDSRASYFHNNVGGYHPAKLALYDDLIQNQLSKNNMRVFDMLNTKYFIISNPQTGQPVAQLNPGALGPCWLVKSIRYVPNADAEMTALNSFEPADTAIVDQREQPKIPFAPQYDSTASIRLVQNLNDQISYEFNAASNQFAVFSEIYYPYGWKAYIDGKETPIARVDYTLRGLAIPAGKHQIEFVFKPASYDKANLISLVVGILSIVLLALCTWLAFKKKEIGGGTAEENSNQ